VLTRGLKNWVVEDGRSIEAAMADARRDEERTLASAQLEAFHQTFNFCMDCRQYTCLDCWNPAEGRCLSCAPTPGQLEAEAAAMPATAFGTAAVPITAGPDEGMVWPTSDLTSDEPAETVVAAAEVTTVLPYVPTDLRPVELPDDEIETIIGAADAAAVEPQAAVEPEAGPIAAVQAEAPEVESEVEPEAVAAIGSGGIAQPEVEDVAEVAMPMAAAAAGAALVTEPDIEIVPEEPEPIAAKEPEPIAAKEPEQVEAEEPEPVAVEPVAAAAALAPEELPEPPRPQPSPAPAAWTIMAPDAGETPSAPPAWPPRAPVYQPPAQAPDVRPAQPGQPAQPAWPSMPPAAFTVPAAQAVWEESSLSVISRPGSGVQACVSCGLPLSATARFCRRCGSRQG
jgi:hypothetical protein